VPLLNFNPSLHPAPDDANRVPDALEGLLVLRIYLLDTRSSDELAASAKVSLRDDRTADSVLSDRVADVHSDGFGERPQMDVDLGYLLIPGFCSSGPSRPDLLDHCTGFGRICRPVRLRPHRTSSRGPSCACQGLPSLPSSFLTALVSRQQFRFAATEEDR
jgi:hypothetical protein